MHINDLDVCVPTNMSVALGPNYSLKRTAEGRLRYYHARAAAAA